MLVMDELPNHFYGPPRRELVYLCHRLSTLRLWPLLISISEPCGCHCTGELSDRLGGCMGRHVSEATLRDESRPTTSKLELR
jgi:hypothetical protein